MARTCTNTSQKHSAPLPPRPYLSMKPLQPSRNSATSISRWITPSSKPTAGKTSTSATTSTRKNTSPENNRTRYTIHPDARREILKRLFELNHAIRERKVAEGLWEKKGKGKMIGKKSRHSDRIGLITYMHLLMGMILL